MKGLDSENARLKKFLPDAMLDNAALKDRLSKKWWRPLPSERRSLIWALRPIICLLISGVTVVITSVGFDPPDAPRLH